MGTSVLYGSFLVGCLVVYRSLQAKEGGAYDYVLTLSAALQTLAFAMLVLEQRSQVAEGLSEKTLWAFLIAHISRLSTTFWGEGYIPEDNTTDVYLYQILEVSGVVMLICKVLNVTTLRTVHDAGHGIERWSMLIGMVGVSGVLAYMTKSTGHDDYFADLSWMFSVWLEAFALAPQVHLLLQAATVDESAVHFAGVTLASSLAFGGFWAKNCQDKYDSLMKNGYHAFFYGILGAVALRMALCAVYFYLFVKTSKVFNGVLTKKPEYELCAQDDEL